MNIPDDGKTLPIRVLSQ